MADDTNTLSGSLEDQPIHLVVSHIDGYCYVKPSRPVHRQRLMGLLMDALQMLQSARCQTVDPADCTLQVFLTVDEESLIKEENT